MSLALMKLAMEGGDDDSSCDEAIVEVAAADATDTVADRLLVVGHEEAVVSQQLPPDSLMTPQKRTRTSDQGSGGPKPTHPNKQKQSGCNAGQDQATTEAASDEQTRQAG